jgi:hypothetical protein
MRSSVVILNALSEASGAIIIPLAVAINPPLIDTSSPIIVRDDSSDPSVNSVRGVRAGGRRHVASLATLSGKVGEPVLMPIGETLELRLEAIACYASQVPVIFRFSQDFRGVVANFAREVGGEPGPAERFWPIVRETL